jgi:hypothetical protein
MQVIPPVTINDAMLTSSTVYEESPDTAYSGASTYALDDVVYVATGTTRRIYKSLQASNLNHTPASSAEWWQDMGGVFTEYASGTTYAVDDYVQVLATHRYYKSLQADNTGHDPATNPDWWKDQGPSNRWAMFDALRNTRTSVPLTFTVVFAPGRRVNSLALSGLRANTYSITVTSVAGGGEVYSASGTLNARTVTSWYEYFYEPFTSDQDTLVFFDLPPYTDAIITLTLSVTEGNAELAACVVGTYIYIGAAEYRAVSDVLNFSKITRDEDGLAVLTPKPNIPKMRVTTVAPKNLDNKMIVLRASLNAVPAFWFGSNDDSDGYFEAIAKLGIYKQFTIRVDLPEHAYIDLEIEEVG